MFKCGNCDRQSKPGEPQVMVVTKTRKKVYVARERTESEPAIESFGHETVREIGVCVECIKRFDNSAVENSLPN